VLACEFLQHCSTEEREAGLRVTSKPHASLMVCPQNILRGLIGLLSDPSRLGVEPILRRDLALMV
jgi:hypothetical protein